MPENRSSLGLANQQFAVVSGGQTGVDRAALDAAAALGVAVGGWCPRRRRAEDERVPNTYPLIETESRKYSVRTELNVRDSDGTLILVLDQITGGTGLTVGLAGQYGRPVHIVRLLQQASGSPSGRHSSVDHVEAAVGWIADHRIRVLNVAGPRASSDDRVYSLSREFCTRVFEAVLALPAPNQTLFKNESFPWVARGDVPQ